MVAATSVTGFTLDGNSVTSDYGINISGGTAARTFTNVTIQNLKTGGYGVYQNAAAPVTFTGGSITGSNTLAGAFYRKAAGALTVSGASITATSQRILLDSDTAGAITFTNVTANMSLTAYAFNMLCNSTFILTGGSYTFSGTPQSFLGWQMVRGLVLLQ